jgi:hypothetical protein
MQAGALGPRLEPRSGVSFIEGGQTWLLAAWFAMPDFQMLLGERAECAPAFARVSMLASLLPRLCDPVLALPVFELNAMWRRVAIC